jgi:hypothetical protein
MPITWKITDRHLVDVVVTGSPTVGDFTTYIREVTEAGGKSYAKLVDMRYASVDLSSPEIKTIAAAVVAQARNDATLGPVAIVVDADASLDVSLLFDDKTAAANRPLAVFGDRDMALAWLMTQRIRVTEPARSRIEGCG